MIVLPPELSPSQMLCLDDVADFSRDLLRRSRALRPRGEWEEAERLARDALDANQGSPGRVSRGAAMIHLSDLDFIAGNLGAARDKARKAYRLFETDPSRYQRHNEAIAAYAVGLACQCLGSRPDALRWYQKSTDLLNRVKIDWAAVNASSQLSCCQRAMSWIEELTKGLTRARAGTPTMSATKIWLPLVRSGAGEAGVEFSMAQLDVEQYVVSGTLQVGDRSFQIELLDGPGSLSLDADTRYYARQIPRKALALLDASNGDYALIQQKREPSEEGPGVVQTLSGPEFGRFERDDSGSIHFVGAGTTVIGDDDIADDLSVGYVAALLRPKSH